MCTPSLQVAELMRTRIGSVHLWTADKDRELGEESLVVDQGLPDDSVVHLTLDDEKIPQ